MEEQLSAAFGGVIKELQVGARARVMVRVRVGVGVWVGVRAWVGLRVS